MSEAALRGNEIDSLNLGPLPFDKYGLTQLVRSSCTFNQARQLLAQGFITQREFARYARIWDNSTFRSNSAVQDARFEIGGQAAVERRYKRATELHAAWRKRVLISMARNCLKALGK